MKTIVLLLVGAIALGAAYFQWFAGSSSAAEKGGTPSAEALFTVRKGDLRITVTEDGGLKAKNSVNVEPQFERWSMITWLVPEGKSVEEGETLAEFEKTETQQQLDELKNQLVGYGTDLEAAQADLEIQKRDSLASVEAADFNNRKAKQNLEKYEKGEEPNEHRKIMLAAEKAKSDFDRATEQFEKVPELEKEGFLTKIQVEEQRIALRESLLNMESAQMALLLYLTYTFPMETEDKDNAVRDTERVLLNAREKSAISTKEKEGRVRSAESRIKQTETRIKKLEKEIENLTVKSPRAGIVLYGEPGNEWMKREIKVGNRWGQGNTMFTIPDLKEMQLLIRVHEADIDLVKKDQEVVVSVEAFKGRTFKGKVTDIGSVADDDWNSAGRKTFKVEVTIEPSDVEMRAGTTAKAEIQVETIVDAVHLPIHAVVAEGAEHFCFVPKAGGNEKRALKIGKNNNHYVQVLEGIKEGEQVLLYDPRSAGETERAREKDGAAGPAAALGGEPTTAPSGTP